MASQAPLPHGRPFLKLKCKHSRERSPPVVQHLSYLPQALNSFLTLSPNNRNDSKAGNTESLGLKRWEGWGEIENVVRVGEDLRDKLRIGLTHTQMQCSYSQPRSGCEERVRGLLGGEEGRITYVWEMPG